MPDLRAERIADFIAPFRVEPGRSVDLGRDFDPGYKHEMVKKEGSSDGSRSASSCCPSTRSS